MSAAHRSPVGAAASTKENDVTLLDNLEKLEQLALASTDGELQYGALNAELPEGETLKDWMARTGDSKQLWVTYQRRSTGDYYCAVTGNGPTSEANARFFACARANTLALIAEVRGLLAKLAEPR